MDCGRRPLLSSPTRRPMGNPVALLTPRRSAPRMTRRALQADPRLDIVQPPTLRHQVSQGRCRRAAQRDQQGAWGDGESNPAAQVRHVTGRARLAEARRRLADVGLAITAAGSLLGILGQVHRPSGCALTCRKPADDARTGQGHGEWPERAGVRQGSDAGGQPPGGAE